MGRMCIVGTILSVVAVLAPASGETWYVDGSVSASGDGKSWETAVKTIQEGIDLAGNGDTVVVALGIYTGPGNATSVRFRGESHHGRITRRCWFNNR